ncbi:transposase zinc-binding domain-containing protein [bacterium]|nr:transposase zinc-binding domain-containing protein [bacterium]
MSVGDNGAVLEVAQIFRQYGPAYRQAHRLPLRHLKVMKAIEACRSEALGGFLQVCDSCGAAREVYRSCRNRHCPKCGWMAREKWLLKRQEELLPVPYFHLVLSIPGLLNALALQNQRVIYDIFFRAASETLLELGRDPKHLGGDIGFMAILHTWGFAMIDHPHLHCVVAGGALSEDEMEWLSPKKSKRKKKFFVHVHIISSLFRGKFIDYLKRAYRKGELKFEGQLTYLQETTQFKKLIETLYDKKWITFCKPSFGGPQQVLN